MIKYRNDCNRHFVTVTEQPKTLPWQMPIGNVVETLPGTGLQRFSVLGGAHPGSLTSTPKEDFSLQLPGGVEPPIHCELSSPPSDSLLGTMSK